MTIELLIIGWLYFWGFVTAFTFLAYSNITQDGEMHAWGAAGIALFWPVFVPAYAAFRAVPRFVRYLKRLEMN